MSGVLAHVTGADTTALRERWVILHHVGLEGGAPVDSIQSDGRGRFRFRVAESDTLATYLVSTDYQGIGYFSEPFRPLPGAAETLPPLVVFDTSSVAPSIELAERHVFVRNRATDGSRRIVELLVLVNGGTNTRIALDGTQPVWTGRIPDEALQFEVGLSDVSDEAITRDGNGIAVFAPIPPGEREMLVSYLLPPDIRELHVPLAQYTEHLAVLLEDSTAVLESDVLTLVGVEELNDAPIHRYEAEGVEAGTPVTVRFRRAPVSIAALAWLMVPVVVAAFAFVFMRWRRKHATELTADEAGDATAIAAEIAALDAAFAGAPTESYRQRRADLKRKLTKVLEHQG